MDLSFVARLPQFSDFEITCGSKVFRCNFSFLQGISPRLAKLTNVKTFALPPLDCLNGGRPSDEIVNDLINFLYGHKISVPPESFAHFYVYGSILDISVLIELGKDLKFSVETTRKVAIDCKRAGHSADFLFPPHAGFDSLHDLPNFTWYSKIHEKAEQLLRAKNSRDVIQSTFQKLIEVADNSLLPTLVLFLRALGGGEYIRSVLSIPGLDLRTAPSLQAALQSCTAPPKPFTGGLASVLSAVRCDEAVKSLLKGAGSKTTVTSFAFTFLDLIMQMNAYRLAPIAGGAFPVSWKLEGTMDGNVWFIVDIQERNQSLNSGDKVFQLKHPSPPFKALKFTQIANSRSSNELALLGFDIVDATIRSVAFVIK
jgi:hypothetical protein